VFAWFGDEECYHERFDTADRIDAPHMTKIIAFAKDLIDALASTETDLLAAAAPSRPVASRAAARSSCVRPSPSGRRGSGLMSP
jgi:hypothetical protein